MKRREEANRIQLSLTKGERGGEGTESDRRDAASARPHESWRREVRVLPTLIQSDLMIDCHRPANRENSNPQEYAAANILPFATSSYVPLLHCSFALLREPVASW